MRLLRGKRITKVEPGSRLARAIKQDRTSGRAAERTRERQVKDDVKNYLDSINAYHHWPVQTGYGEYTLDCLASINGHFVGIETKRPGKTMTEKQAEIAERMRMSGGFAIKVDSVYHLIDFVRKHCGLL